MESSEEMEMEETEMEEEEEAEEGDGGGERTSGKTSLSPRDVVMRCPMTMFRTAEMAECGQVTHVEI